MNKLSCSAHKCVYNEGGLCSAEYIEIHGIGAKTKEETYCSNFMINNFINNITTFTNTDLVGELLQVINGFDEVKMAPNITCRAHKCFYNIEGKCEARAIMIMEDNKNSELCTLCQTFEVD